MLDRREGQKIYMLGATVVINHHSHWHVIPMLTGLIARVFRVILPVIHASETQAKLISVV